MLDVAIKYKEELENIQYDTWFNDQYKFWNNDPFYDSMSIDDSTYNKHQFVSIKNNQIIGYIEYTIDRVNEYITNLSIINFSDNKLTFGMDLGKALKDIFEKYNFRKMVFYVVVGNPIESTYDKMIYKYNGRIVGVFKDNVKLIDNNYYDVKYYEITKEDYLMSHKRK